jgi:hypothetical protein
MEERMHAFFSAAVPAHGVVDVDNQGNAEVLGQQILYRD